MKKSMSLAPKWTQPWEKPCKGSECILLSWRLDCQGLGSAYKQCSRGQPLHAGDVGRLSDSPHDAARKPWQASSSALWDLLLSWGSGSLPLLEAMGCWFCAGPCPWPAKLTSQLDLGPASLPWAFLATTGLCLTLVAVTVDCCSPGCPAPWLG